MERKLLLYIATSLDGYIAGENDDLSFLEVVEQEGEDYGYAEFINKVVGLSAKHNSLDCIN